MAGKTLPGIGEDESGEHDAADSSGPSLRLGGAAGGLTGARSTDRMPISMPAASGFSGPTVVDEDKVAEGLKKLRSLDEPLGPMPTTAMPSDTMPPRATPVSAMPTLKEGMPVVGAVPPPMTPAVAAAELLRSRGTAHGHALSGPSGNPASLLPVAVDDRMKGTLLGHTLHLPDLPEPAEEKSRPAEVRSIATTQQVPPAGSLRPSEMVADFSNGDSRFFETEPVNDLELERPRPNLMFRGVVFFAVISVFAVAAFAWVNARKSDADAQVAQPEAAPAPAPTPAPAAAEPAAAAVPPAPAPAQAAAVVPPAEPAPAPAPAPAAVEQAPAPQPPPAKVIKRELTVVDEAKAARPSSTHSSTRPTRHTDSTRDVPPLAAKPTPTPTPTPKRGKNVEDPDGTLPLSD